MILQAFYNVLFKTKSFCQKSANVFMKNPLAEIPGVARGIMSE